MFEIPGLLKATNGRLVNAKFNAIVRGISIDSRTIRSGDAFIAIKGENFDGHDFIDEAIKKGAGCIIFQAQRHKVPKPPGIPCIEVQDTIRALGDIAKFHREKYDTPVITVTGSNGKTTTKEMVAWVLSKRFKVLKNTGTKNNHIGLPLTLLNLDESYDIAVLEIGTNHFGEVGNLATISKPNIGVITNIGSAHLEYFKNLRGVLKEKSSLLDHLESPGIAVLNADDNLLKGKISSKNSFKAIGAGIKNRSDFFASGIKRKGEKLEFCVNQKYRFTLRTLGYYNIYNALIAVAIGRIFGMEYSVLSQRLTYFNFPQSRLNLLELNKIKFINDTYNSNPVSLREALDVLGNFRTKGRKIFVMGDMLELGKQKGLFHRKAGLEASGVCDVFITVGRLSKFAAREARLNGLDAKNIFTCESTLEAKDILFKKINLCPEDIVLIKGSRSMKMEEVLKQI